MGMGDDDLFYGFSQGTRGLQQCLQMLLILRTGINDSQAFLAKQITVGAWPGHHARVARQNPPGMVANGGELAGNQ